MSCIAGDKNTKDEWLCRQLTKADTNAEVSFMTAFEISKKVQKSITLALYEMLHTKPVILQQLAGFIRLVRNFEKLYD